MSEVDGNIRHWTLLVNPASGTLHGWGTGTGRVQWTGVYGHVEGVQVVPADQLRGAVDALDFTRRTLDDPDLDEAEALMRIGGVVRRTLDQIEGQS